MPETIGNLLKNTILKSDTAQLDSEILLAFVLKKNRTFLFAHPEKIITKQQQRQFTNLIKQRNLQQPIAYLTGKQSFWSLNLKITNAVLIPRSDTETLVNKALGLIADYNQQAVLDLGTGSGAIALAVATEFPNIKITAVDNSLKAIKVAQYNAKQLRCNNVLFVVSNWFDKITDKFDLILSNPPYIDKNDPHLKALKFEPLSALVSNNNGLSDIEHIIKNARCCLNKNGFMMVEHGCNQAKSVRKIFNESGFKQITTIKDLAQLDRVTVGQC